MKSTLVITLIGPDRTGLVESVARVVAEHGGNWLESRLARLGGEFAGLVRVEVPAEQESALLAALPGIAGLQVVVQASRPVAAPDSGPLRRLEIIGSDRPGIVRDITSALARAQVNVEEFASEITSAPMSGEPLFHATIRLRFPAQCDLAALQRELEQIAADLLVDVAFAETVA